MALEVLKNRGPLLFPLSPCSGSSRLHSSGCSALLPQDPMRQVAEKMQTALSDAASWGLACRPSGAWLSLSPVWGACSSLWVLLLPTVKGKVYLEQVLF